MRTVRKSMEKIESLFEEMQIFRADHLPIMANFCRQINLIETINRVVPNNMNVDVGTIIQGMVLDTLSSRSPLYRLAFFFFTSGHRAIIGTRSSWDLI